MATRRRGASGREGGTRGESGRGGRGSGRGAPAEPPTGTRRSASRRSSPETGAATAERAARSDARDGAVAAEELEAPFPPIDLPVRPPFPPMEARSVPELPREGDWLFEPKWDGFRCLAFRRDGEVLLQSKAGQPLTRYFPEVAAALAGLPHRAFVLDGEIIVAREGHLSFDDLLQRIHPAASRIRRLAAETPAQLLAFDLLVEGRSTSLLARPLEQRRERLQRWFEDVPAGGTPRLSPATRDRKLASSWMRELVAAGLDGVIAKDLHASYRSGEREGMRKVKLLRTADCVVGGFRYAQKGGEIGSLLLGLYDDEGLLHHVGFAASFTLEERRALKPILEPRVEPPGFTGNAPGGPTRWATGRSTEWQPLRPELVCEVRYDHFSGGRFRHGTKFLRWRPDKRPRACTFDQVSRRAGRALERLGLRL